MANGESNGLTGWGKTIANLSAVAVALWLLAGLVDDLKQTNRERLKAAVEAHERLGGLVKSGEDNAQATHRLAEAVGKLAVEIRRKKDDLDQ